MLRSTPHATMTTKTPRLLADGREIIYYDRAPVDRAARDRRELPVAGAGAELRFDPVVQTWVMYASHRQHRSYLPSARDCPLCPSTPDHPTEIPEADYEVVVFENRFPALSTAEPGSSEALGPGMGAGEPGTPPLLFKRPGAGRCEVVCYSSDHSSSFAQLSLERVSTVIDALIDRTVELGARPDVEQVFCFENRGREIGVTQPHPHGQIYAYPFVAAHTAQAVASARAYRRERGRNLFDDMLARERSDGQRVVVATEHWSAFVPFAARWPFELHCYPNHRVPDLASLGPAALSELPGVLVDIYARFDRLFGKPAPYIAGWHQAPAKTTDPDFAMHLEMFTVRRTPDKLKYPAGSEAGMDAYTNDVIPEEAAERLRSAHS